MHSRGLSPGNQQATIFISYKPLVYPGLLFIGKRQELVTNGDA